MNIHGVLAGPPPFHTKPSPSPSCRRRRRRPPPHPLPVASCPFTTPCDIHRTATSQRLKSQYAFVRLTKSTVGSTVKQIERERERERVARSPSGEARAGTAERVVGGGARPVVIAFELEITFRTAKCRFSPPHINGSLSLEDRLLPLSHLRPSTNEGKIEDFRHA